MAKTYRGSLYEDLLNTSPSEFHMFLEQHRAGMYRSACPFTEFMRKKFREKKIAQQDVFLAAYIPERYGYKLISGQKHTTDRDTILRLCIAARFLLEEVQEALILYRMAPLYEKLPRDAAFIVAFSNRIDDIGEVDAILRQNGLPPFLIPDAPA